MASSYLRLKYKSELTWKLTGSDNGKLSCVAGFLVARNVMNSVKENLEVLKEVLGESF